MLRSSASRSRIRHGVCISSSDMPGRAGTSYPTSRPAYLASMFMSLFSPTAKLTCRDRGFGTDDNARGLAVEEATKFRAELLERSHHRKSSWDRVKPLDSSFGDEQHLAGLNSSAAIRGHDIGLHHDGLSGAERLSR